MLWLVLIALLVGLYGLCHAIVKLNDARARWGMFMPIIGGLAIGLVGYWMLIVIAKIVN